MTQLRKIHIGPLSVALLIFCVVASGAFGIEEMIPITGPGMTIVLLCVLPIVWALPNSLLVSEVSTLLPKDGGFYVWAKEAFGDFWGFQTGWWVILLEYISSSTYVVLASSYICQIFNIPNEYSYCIKVLMIAVFTVVNLIGLKSTEKTSVIISAIVVITFIVLVIIGFCHIQSNPFVPFTNPNTDFFSSAGGGFAIAVWMYCGWEAIASIAGEIKNRKAIANGLKIAVPLISLSYLLPVLACLCALPAGSWENWTIGSGVNGDGVGFATVFSYVFGNAGMIVFLIVAALSNCAIYSSYMTSVSRTCYAMSDDNLFPKKLSNIDKSGRSPYIGVISVALISLVLSLLPFTNLVEIEIIFDLSIYIILPLIALKLRKKYPIEKRDKKLFVIGGGKLGIWLCCVVPIVVAFFIILMQDPHMVIYYTCALVFGVLVYIIVKLIYGGSKKIDKKDIKRIVCFLLLLVVILGISFLLG